MLNAPQLKVAGNDQANNEQEEHKLLQPPSSTRHHEWWAAQEVCLPGVGASVRRQRTWCARKPK